MAAQCRTILSVGEVLYDYLTKQQSFKDVSDQLFPIIAEAGATLPYVCFKRTGIRTQQTKGIQTADECTIAFVCYAETYDESVEMVEVLRSLLENKEWSHTWSDGASLRVRSTKIEDSDEGYDDDAYAQTLLVTFRIN